MTPGLVLSIFPGIDLLGRAFEEEGWCVVRGPDLIWGGDIRGWHPPTGVFEGVIGGPPCKGESNLAYLNGNAGETMAPEFFRIVEEANPRWWVMEAVIRHDAPHILKLSPRWLGEKQSRKRYFHSSIDLEQHVEVALFEHPEYKHVVLASGHGDKIGTVKRGMAKYSFEEMCELQGLPAGFDVPLLTMAGKREVVGNGVPMAMGRAVAQAVRRATQQEALGL